MISPAKLGLTSPRAAEDLEELGFDSDELLWTLAGTGDPDLALNNTHRFMQACGNWPAVGQLLIDDPLYRTRFLALMGGSTALADHLIANPDVAPALAQPVPSAEEALEFMRAAAGVDGADEASLRSAYRTLITRVAAADLAGTFAKVKGHGEGERLGYRAVTETLTAIADAALTAALDLAVKRVYGDEEPDSRLAVIAMGKCGARELNYISDVDVIFVAEPVTPKITRTAAEFMKIGSAAFFEVDANLRPEGKSGALVRTVDSHRAYYKLSLIHI